MRWLDGITDSMDMSLSKLRGDGERQGSLACCHPWGHKELDMTEQLNNSICIYIYIHTYVKYIFVYTLQTYINTYVDLTKPNNSLYLVYAQYYVRVMMKVMTSNKETRIN